MNTHMKKEDASILKDTAAAIGGAAGKVAAIAKAILPHAATETPKARKVKNNGRFAPKNKARLPRKEKKALAKKNAKVS